MTVGVTFPIQSTWIPNQKQFTDSGAGILALVGAALDQQGRGEPYGRRIYSHGGRIPWRLGLPRNQQGQILVSLTKVFMGKAGEEQFQFDEGNYGKVGKRVMQFLVQVVNSWPVLRGGASPGQEPDSAIEAQTVEIWQDGLIVLSALWALQLRGVTTTPPVAPIVQDRILVGSFDPVGPEGGLAGWECNVFVQM